MTQAAILRRTSLHSVHAACGAKMVDFGGWDMPVQYSGILEEHHAVRKSVGLFDVSHMGEIEVRGPEAALAIDYLTTANAQKLKIGQAKYAGLLFEHGGFVDDILVHKVAPDHFFLCVNASNQDADFAHMTAHNRFEASIDQAGARYAQLAIQGPKALETLQQLTHTDLKSIKYYWFTDGEVAGIWSRIARTGYTGEDGFEIYFAADEASVLWAKLLQAGEAFGIKPCGLGARNTLRLEAKMALYGHEITASINPLEADLAWIVDFDKPEFIGRQPLAALRETGLTRKLVGFEMVGRGIGRDGYPVLLDGTEAGWVTSGGPAPTLGKNIGLCYLPAAEAVPGRAIQILIRNQAVDAVTVPTPFYRRAK